jgi:hypothetical protein
MEAGRHGAGPHHPCQVLGFDGRLLAQLRQYVSLPDNIGCELNFLVRVFSGSPRLRGEYSACFKERARS